MIRIGLLSGKSFLDRLVQYFSGSKYSHAFIICGNMKIEAMAGVGVREANIYSYGGKWTADLFDIDATEEQQEKMWSYAWGQKGKKYDYSGVMHFVFFWRRQSKYRWFCSELVEAAAREAGISLSGKVPDKTKPCDLLNKGLLKKSGELRSI